MKGRIIIVCFLVVMLLAINLLFGNKKENTDVPERKAWTASLDNIDFSDEITGMLSEGTIDEMLDYEDAFVETIGSGQHSNKVLRWGICRRGYGKTPDADPGTPELLKRYGGFYLGDANKNEIYLTFDEGYENGYTPKILDVLKENNVKAVFFITGPYLKEHQDLVDRMVEEGHTVGNHTINHPSLPSLGDIDLKEEIQGLDGEFYEKFNKHMKFLRPPKGEYSERTLALTQKMGYTNLFWSFAYDDWYRDRQRGQDYAHRKVMDNLHNGAVILLHAVSKDNADALESIIKGAREKGFEFGDVNNLCNSDL
jgi:peptidoglycan-N-acetylmuramic acid deacetylase